MRVPGYIPTFQQADPEYMPTRSADDLAVTVVSDGGLEFRQAGDGVHEWLLDPAPGTLAEPWKRT